jgi:2-keto-4-pentenoate hydratase/2-oxohepta-3-ene-1,7-dioic acid hydratase in catechol pathway
VGFRLANVGGRGALVDGDHYYDLEDLADGALSPDPMAALTTPDLLAELASGLGGRQPTGLVPEATLGPPVPRPRNSYGVGLNYRSHAEEASMEIPDVPLVFTKFPSCITGPFDEVRLRSDRCDYEGELVVVVGPGGADIDPADAWDHVVGLTVGQDVSDRHAQFMTQPPQFNLGKSFDTFGPIGPVVVSPDCFDDPDDLALTTHVNGEARQDDRTSNMVFPVADLVAFLSRITALATGDIIFTGTPDGIGAAQGLFLADGDVITTTIDGIGTMTNACVRVADWR